MGETASIEPVFTRRRALGVLALVAAACMVWVSRGVGVGILLGALTAFVVEPLYLALGQRLHGRWTALLLCMALVLASVGLVLIGTSAILVARGRVLFAELVAQLGPGGSLRVLVEGFGRRLAPLGLDVAHLVDEMKDAAGSIAGYTAGLAATIAGETLRVLVGVFFLVLTCGHLLARGRSLERAAEEVSPLDVRHTRALFVELRRVGRAILLGTVVTGLAQGALAAAIFLVVGLPEQLFFGAAAAVASLIPSVGTLLVWVPAGIYLIATGHLGRGIAELALSAALVIGVCDYVLRPRLVAGDTMPALLTFAALFGGLEAFGVVGLVTGPLLMSLAVAVLRLYRADRQGRLEELLPEPQSQTS